MIATSLFSRERLASADLSSRETMNRTRLNGVLLALLVAFLPAAPLSAGEYVQKQGSGVLRLEPDNEKIRKADNLFKVEDGLVEARLSVKLLLTLTIEGNAPLKIDGGTLAEQVKALEKSGLWFSCKAVGPETRTAAGNGRERWEAAIRLDPLPPKENTIELVPLPVEYTEGSDGKRGKVEWQPIKLRITTDVASLDPKKELRDITPPESPPAPPPSWTRWLPWAGLAAAVAGLVAGGWGLRRRFASPARPLAPHEWAARELAGIEAQHLPEAGETERYHTLLSDVVRAYLERRFNLPASQQTTAEFLETMRRSPQLTPAQQGLLRTFLERCDMAKFARAAPPPEECRAVADMARSFVQETTPRPQ
jgi:Domain of unknown function (DUF4381)